MEGEPKGFYKFKKDMLEGVNVINKNQFEKISKEEQINYLSRFKLAVPKLSLG